MKIDSYGITHVGQKRDNNEDQFLIANLNKSLQIKNTSIFKKFRDKPVRDVQGWLYVVADGVGGSDAGEEASRLAIETVIRYLLTHMPWFISGQEDFPNELHKQLEKGLRSASEAVQKEAKRRAGSSMGTTLTVAYVLWPWMYIIHAGDSRCYLCRKTKLDQVTTDHTVANELVKDGAISEEEAEKSPFKNILSNVIGGSDFNKEVNPEFIRVKLKQGDSILLCSDGLTKHVPEEELVKHMSSSDSAEEMGKTLVEEANQAGGTDNITLVIARFLEGDDSDDE